MVVACYDDPRTDFRDFFSGLKIHTSIIKCNPNVGIEFETTPGPL